MAKKKTECPVCLDGGPHAVDPDDGTLTCRKCGLVGFTNPATLAAGR